MPTLEPTNGGGPAIELNEVCITIYRCVYRVEIIGKFEKILKVGIISNLNLWLPTDYLEFGMDGIGY